MDRNDCRGMHDDAFSGDDRACRGGNTDAFRPEGAVGSEIPVTVRIDGGGQPIGDVNVTLSYDTALLEFMSGTAAEGGEGTVTLARSGTGEETEMVFELLFRGLAEGTAAIQVTNSTAYLFSDETLNLSAGESAVTIGAGDGTTPSTEPSERVLGQEIIDIDGASYSIYENFTDALIPAGFTRSTVQYAGVEHSAIRQDASGKVILFMVTGEADPITVFYNESDSTFVRTERVDVSESFYLFVLGSADGSGLPEAFVDTTLSLHEVNFPAWQNMDAQEFYLVYALSSAGVEGFYQYDTVDKTYQRYVASDPSEPTEPEEEEDNSTLGKIQKIITDNLLILAAAVAVIVVILFIIILVLSIKLGRRNAELDDLYAGDVDNTPKVKKKSRQQFVGYDDDDDLQDDEDDYLEDEFEDDDFDDDYLDSEDDYDDFDDYDDEDDIKEYVSEKRVPVQKHRLEKRIPMTI